MKYLRPGMAILDLGVGGGRTTPYLSSIAGRYVGVDYASEMIAACRKKFPQLEFETANVADLSNFNSSSFDAAVMAFNGMDDMIPDESRFRALREIGRVLKPAGILIFSSHNPAGDLGAGIVESATGASSGTDYCGERLGSLSTAAMVFDRNAHDAGRTAGCGAVAGPNCAKIAHKSLLARRRLLVGSRAWWYGDSCGGPERVSRELGRFGFRLLRVLGDDYPRSSRLYVTDWYYYVFSKTEATGEK